MVNFNWKIHGLVVLSCLFILAVSFLIGIFSENLRLSGLEESLREENLDFKRFDLYRNANSLFGFPFNESCSTADAFFDDLGFDLVNSLRIVESFGNNIQGERFKEFYSLYLIDNLRYWLFFESVDRNCVLNKTAVLYFYSLDDCPSCDEQGNVLTKLRVESEDTFLVFPVNIEFSKDEFFVDFLLDQFNIRSFPSLIIKGEVYSGFMSEKEIKSVFCNNEESLEFDFCN